MTYGKSEESVTISRALSEVPGVLGVCLLRGSLMFGSPLPGGPGPGQLQELIPVIAEAMGALSRSPAGVEFVSVTFREVRLLFADLRGGAALITHDPGVDVLALTDRLKSQADALSARLEELVQHHPAPSREGTPTDLHAHARAEAVALPPQATLSDLHAELERLLKALTHALGPAATVVLDDALTRWLRGGPPSRERLAELVELLSHELPGEREQAHFEREIAPMIRGTS